MTISLDATSSLLQIISVLSKNKELMLYTNVYSSKESKDIYDYLIGKLKVIYKKEYFLNYYINRKIVKRVCMTYIYGSTPKYLSEDLIKVFSLKILLIDLIKITSNIIKLFNELFPVIYKIKRFVNYYIKLLPVD